MKYRLGEILIQRGLVSKENVTEALEEQKKSRKPLGQILVEKRYLSEKALLTVLGELEKIDFVELKKIKIAPEAVKAVPAKLATHYKIMPVALEKGVLSVALHDPANHWPLEDIEVNLGLHPKMVLACYSDIAEAIRKYYGVGADTVERILQEAPAGAMEEEAKRVEESVAATEDVAGGVEDATVVRLVDQILHEAVRREATDIHVEHSRQTMVVRYRVDGILIDAELPREIHFLSSPIISRIKIMAGMDIVERRLPQDGRARIRLEDKEFDLRFSSLPTCYGEDIAIRLLPSQMEFGFEKLGVQGRSRESFEQLIQKPHGIVFVTGPTGSGKSTTLYTCLSQVNSRDRKIVTVEDPVEYEIPGITQLQTNAGIGFTFARALRNILRHDPDIIMLGEVRDMETAEIAIQAALTGHLVFSTLHTNDAVSGATRLIDMGIDPYLITSSVEAFVAQRLVRTICKNCKGEASREELEPWLKRCGNGRRANGFTFYRGRGCEVCHQTGYQGRMAIFEILLMSDGIRDLILKRAAASDMKKLATQQGMTLLWEDGWQKVIDGLTTPEEVVRVTEES